MSFAELKSEYERLRRELETAYAAPVWNSGLIDRIANALTNVERTLLGPSVAARLPTSTGKAVHTRQIGMHRT